MKEHLQNNHQDECEILSRYLIRISPAESIRTSYHLALQKIPISFSDSENALWLKCLHNNWLLPYIDSYLACKYPSHPIRKKIFLMLALLEAHPEYTGFFLPARSTYPAFAVSCIKLVQAFLKAAAGRILIWII